MRYQYVLSRHEMPNLLQVMKCTLDDEESLKKTSNCGAAPDSYLNEVLALITPKWQNAKFGPKHREVVIVKLIGTS